MARSSKQYLCAERGRSIGAVVIKEYPVKRTKLEKRMKEALRTLRESYMGLGWLLFGNVYFSLCATLCQARESQLVSHWECVLWDRKELPSDGACWRGNAKVGTSCSFLPQLLLGNLTVVTNLKPGFMGQQVSLVLSLYLCL